MVEFIDKTTETDGTPLNRTNMMAIQGYQSETVTFSNNTVTKVNSDGHTETVTFSGNTVVKQFVGERTITETVTFDGNQIRKVVR